MLGIVFDISFYLLLQKYDSFKRNSPQKHAMCGRVCRHNIMAKMHHAMCVMTLSNLRTHVFRDDGRPSRSMCMSII